MTPNDAYLLYAYDDKLHQGQSITLEAYVFVTNGCRATPDTFPDSPSNAESGEVFGVALHLFVTKFFGPWVMNQPWLICGVICIQKAGAFWCQMQSKGMGIWCSMLASPDPKNISVITLLTILVTITTVAFVLQ